MNTTHRIIAYVMIIFPMWANAQSLENSLELLFDSVYKANKDALGILIHVESPSHSLSWSKALGYSDSSRTTILDVNQPVLIASNTKTYVSAATLRLAEDSLIGIDDPIADLLSNKTHKLLEQDGYKLNEITIRHLLSHTSGIHDHVDQDYFDLVIKRPQYQWTKEEQILR